MINNKGNKGNKGKKKPQAPTPSNKKKHKYPHAHRGFVLAMYSAKTRWQVEGIESIYAKLNDAEREWYSRFLLEFHNGAVKVGDPNAIHKTKAERKICYDRKNAAGRDLFSLLNAQGKFAGNDINEDADSAQEDGHPNYIVESK